MYYVLFLYCKDTTKSNNRQIFKGKSYCIVYYLTFINNKIKDYYINTYFLMLFILLYVISLYYIYTLLYIKKEQRNHSRKRANERTEQEEREPGRRMPPTPSPVPLFCLLPSPSTPSPVLPFLLRLRFLLFFAMISSARSHLFALPSSCSSFLALLPAY